MSESNSFYFEKSLCLNKDLQCNANILEEFFKKYKNNYFSYEEASVYLNKHKKKKFVNKTKNIIWDSMAFLYKKKRIKLVKVEEKESGRGFLVSYFQHIDGANKELPWYLKEFRKDLWLPSKFIDTYVPCEFTAIFKKNMKSNNWSNYYQEFLLSDSLGSFEIRKSIPIDLQKGYKLSAFYTEYKKLFGATEGYKLLFKLFSDIWRSSWNYEEKLITYKELLDNFESSMKDFDYEAYQKHQESIKLFKEHKIYAVSAPWDSSLWRVLKNFLFFQSTKTNLYFSKLESILDCKTLDDYSISFSSKNESCNIVTDIKELNDYIPLNVLFKIENEKKECSKEKFIFILSSLIHEIDANCKVYTKDYWKTEFYISLKLAREIQVKIKEEKRENDFMKPLTQEEFINKKIKDIIKEKFSENLEKAYSLQEVIKFIKNSPKMRKITKYEIIDALHELYHSKRIKTIEGYKLQLENSPVEGYLYIGENEDDYCTVEGFLEVPVKYSLVELIKNKCSRLQKYQTGWFGDLECSIPCSDYCCLYKKSDLEKIIKNDEIQKALKKEVKDTTKNLEKIIVSKNYEVPKVQKSENFNNLIKRLNDNSYKAKVKLKLEELKFPKDELDEALKCINILKNNINTKYDLWKICEEVYPDISFVTEEGTRYYKLQYQRMSKILRLLRTLKIIKIVGITDEKSAGLLYQIQESPLEEQEFVDYYNKEFVTISSFVFDENISLIELNIAIKKENIKYFCTRVHNIHNPCKVYKKIELKQLIEKYNLKRIEGYVKTSKEIVTEVTEDLPKQTNELQELKELLAKSQEQITENQKQITDLKEAILKNQKQILKNQEQQLNQPIQITPIIQNNKKFSILGKFAHKFKKLFTKKKAPNLNPEETIQF